MAKGSHSFNHVAEGKGVKYVIMFEEHLDAAVPCNVVVRLFVGKVKSFGKLIDKRNEEAYFIYVVLAHLLVFRCVHAAKIRSFSLFSNKLERFLFY